MTKEQLKEKTMEVLSDRYQNYLKSLNALIDKMSESVISDYDNDYFLPQACNEALFAVNNSKIEERWGYSSDYVRKYKKAVRILSRQIFDAL